MITLLLIGAAGAYWFMANREYADKKAIGIWQNNSTENIVIEISKFQGHYYLYRHTFHPKHDEMEKRLLTYKSGAFNIESNLGFLSPLKVSKDGKTIEVQNEEYRRINSAKAQEIKTAIRGN